ncbi:MAG TPA: pilus assembly PilX N-terminal domain-containing protein [Trueperaceae bacterium]
MRSDKGIAIITALLIMVVVGLLATGGALVTRMELNIARNDASSLQAHYAAQAGLQKYKTILFQYFRFLETISGTQNPERTACFDRMGTGMDIDRDGSEEYLWSGGEITFAEEWVKNSSGEEVGSYVVTIHRDSGNKNMFTIESKGRSNGARATVRSTLLVENTGVLENAIFTGQGQTNQYLNGGVTIRGGVYVVGDENNPNNTVIGANGNFSMLNEYDLTNGNYEAMRYRVSDGNRVADNLCASLRVDNGQVELNGSVKLGDPSNWLLGVYIGDSQEDLKVTDTLLQCVENKGICSEIGRFTLDLSEGGAPKFPLLGDEPAEESGCTEATWSDCIFQSGLKNGLVVAHVASTGAGYPLFGSTGAQDGVSDECEDFLSDPLLVFSNSAVDCTYTDANGVLQGFRYTTSNGWSSASFQVYGTVSLHGYDVKFDWPVEYVAKTLNGPTEADVEDWNASFVVEANGSGAGGGIDINQNFLTSDDEIDITGKKRLFPDHVLGLVAEGEVYQRAANVMAPVYAGDTFRIIKGNKILGSVVANKFCTTSAGDSIDCNAGQNAEVIYVNTGHNKPDIMQYVDSAGIPLFKVLSYERR